MIDRIAEFHGQKREWSTGCPTLLPNPPRCSRRKPWHRSIAYAAAVDIIGAEGSLERMRHMLAKHMMVLARNSETDEDRLCSLSVVAVLGRSPARRLPTGPRASASDLS